MEREPKTGGLDTVLFNEIRWSNPVDQYGRDPSMVDGICRDGGVGTQEDTKRKLRSLWSCLPATGYPGRPVGVESVKNEESVPVFLFRKLVDLMGSRGKLLDKGP